MPVTFAFEIEHVFSQSLYGEEGYGAELEALGIHQQSKINQVAFVPRQQP